MVKRAKRYSNSFKVVLVLLGAITIAYFAKLFTGKKQIILADADTVAAIHPPVKHKHKRRIKVHAPVISEAKPDTMTAADKLNRAELLNAGRVTVKAVQVKPVTDSTANKNSNFLYTTYVRPNVTGIVKLRQDDKYYADIIADIPANAKVRVLKKGAMYYQVVYNNNIGFVPKWALQAK